MLRKTIQHLSCCALLGLFLVVLFPLSAITSSGAAPHRDQMQYKPHTTPTYTVVTDFWPPFRIKGTDGSITGIDKDIIDEVGRRMGIQFQWIRRPWVRCLTEIKHGDADLITGFAKTPEREKYTLYTKNPYYILSPAFYAHKDAGANIVKTYDDLKGLTVGFVRGSAYFRQFDTDETLRKDPASTEENLLSMLAAKRVDVIIGTDSQVEYDLVQMKLTREIVKTQYRPEKEIRLYMGFSRRSPFVNRYYEFNDILEQLVEDGTVKAIADKYLTQ